MPEQLFEKLAPGLGAPFIVCPWGVDYVFARTTEGKNLRIPINPAKKVVDPIGAGDAFNAGLIAAQLAGANEQESINAGISLAARKVETIGFELSRP